jgi:hypothetical protein
MQKETKNFPASRSMLMAYGAFGASYAEAEKRKPLSNFFYLFIALVRRASADKEVQELQNLSDLIETEIQELKKTKLRVRDVLHKK